MHVTLRHACTAVTGSPADLSGTAGDCVWLQCTEDNGQRGPQEAVVTATHLYTDCLCTGVCTWCACVPVFVCAVYMGALSALPLSCRCLQKMGCSEGEVQSQRSPVGDCAVPGRCPASAHRSDEWKERREGRRGEGKLTVAL